MTAAPLVINIAGIFTGRTDPNWKDRLGYTLERELPNVALLNRHYRAGAFAPKTHWYTNPRAAAELLSRVILYREMFPEGLIYIVSHSNGTNVAVLLAQRLAALGISVEVMAFLGSAVHSDVKKSGVHDLLTSGHLGRAVAYCSPDDPVILPLLQRIPGFWGSLGSKGWTRDGVPTGLLVQGYDPLNNGNWGRDRHRLITRWFPRYGHSQWLKPPDDAATFACLIADLGLAA